MIFLNAIFTVLSFYVICGIDSMCAKIVSEKKMMLQGKGGEMFDMAILKMALINKREKFPRDIQVRVSKNQEGKGTSRPLLST